MQAPVKVINCMSEGTISQPLLRIFFENDMSMYSHFSIKNSLGRLSKFANVYPVRFDNQPVEERKTALFEGFVSMNN